MKIEDRIHGDFEVEESVLLDLLASQAVRRLDGVLQHGISALVGVTRPVTRLEHSLGVMLLVRRLGAGIEEQIAALLHDVSHTAFSHVIDYVFDGHDTQSYHEEQKEPYMAASDIPAVLARHGFDWRAFLHEEDFPLLEQPSPDLCADRLDYFLRDSLDLGLATGDQVRSAIQHLVVYGDRIIVDDIRAARWMGETFMTADDASWANLREVGLYELTAIAIRTALRLEVLEEKDLWGTDQIAWAKMCVSRDPELQAQLALVSAETGFVLDESAPDFSISTKLRTIDPLVLLHGRLRPLSILDPEFAARRRAYLERKAGKWPIRIIRKS